MENWLLIYISKLRRKSLTYRCISHHLSLHPQCTQTGTLPDTGQTFAEPKQALKTDKQTNKIQFHNQIIFKRAASCIGSICFTKQDIKMTTLKEKYHQTDLL